jgi:transposase-like protein
MVSKIIACPYCQATAPVVRYGTNRSGSARCQCTACERTFTPKPHSRRVTEEKEEAILRALEERLSLEAIARLLKVAKKTIYKILKKRKQAAASIPDADRSGL